MDKTVYFRLKPGVSLHSSDELILAKVTLPSWLKVKMTPSNTGLWIQYSPYQGQRPLSLEDKGYGQNPGRGISRLHSILSILLDAKDRLMTPPSLEHLGLDNIFLRPSGLSLPILPIEADSAFPCNSKGTRLKNPPFWAEWGAFYRVEPEWIQLCSQYGKAFRYKELDTIMKNYWNSLKQWGVGLTPSIQATSPLPKLASQAPLGALYRVDERTGKQIGRPRYLFSEETIIGRDPLQCDLVLDEKWIGRKHALIRYENGLFFLQDCFSVNGTYLDGQKLRPEAVSLMPPVCRLRLGSSDLEFRSQSSATLPRREASAQPFLSAKSTPRLPAQNYLVPNRRSPASPSPGTMYM